jgi:lipoprotein
MRESPVCVTIAPLFASVITTIGVSASVCACTSVRVSFASFQLKASAGESSVSFPVCEISPLNTFSSYGKTPQPLKKTTPATNDQSQIFFIRRILKIKEAP